MQLIGYMDSPFVRRVAVSARFLGIALEQRALSVFRNYDEFAAINPLVKAPTLVLGDGRILVESTLIIDYLESLAGTDKSLLPQAGNDRIKALHLIGAALSANEKVAQLVYETTQRPVELQHQPWIDRLEEQLRAAVGVMQTVIGDGESWLFGDALSQADITAAISWRFVQHVVPQKVPATDFPGLVRFSARAEALPEFIFCPLS